MQYNIIIFINFSTDDEDDFGDLSGSGSIDSGSKPHVSGQPGSLIFLVYKLVRNIRES